MRTRFKVTAAAVLVAAFSGALAEEAVVEEIVVVGKRATSVPEVEVAAKPAAPEVTLESVAPQIKLPEIELVGFARDRS